MSLRRLRLLVLPILALSISAYAQSVADVARQTRAELLQNGDGHLKVFTNEDIASPRPAPAPARDASAQKAGKDGEDGAQAASSTVGANPGTAAATGKEQTKDGRDGDKSSNSPADEHAAKALEAQQRTDEMNQRYLDRIASIRKQIETTQQNVTKLQQDQIESTNLFRQSAGVAPSIPEYEQQMRFLDEQLAAQRDLIVSLKAQLDDAHEAARHAGVPHADDY
jgi:flagellar biosynthesis chaperone FliJ